jgi:hypothetical protein
MKKDQNPKCPAPIDRLLERADEFARHDPTRATLTALGAGIALNLLPLGAIAAKTVDIAFSLVRPALLSLGLFRALELLRNKTQAE